MNTCIRTCMRAYILHRNINKSSVRSAAKASTSCFAQMTCVLMTAGVQESQQALKLSNALRLEEVMIPGATTSPSSAVLGPKTVLPLCTPHTFLGKLFGRGLGRRRLDFADGGELRPPHLREAGPDAQTPAVAAEAEAHGTPIPRSGAEDGGKGGGGSFLGSLFMWEKWHLSKG